MSLTKVTYSMISGGVNSVLDFGADPTGAADCTTAFNLCLADCRANLKAMYIPAGEYLVNSPLDAGAMLNIFGDGPNATLIKPVFSSVGYLFTFNSAGGNWQSLKNFGVIGPAQYSANEKFVLMSNAYNTNFDSIYLYGLGGGFRLSNAWSVHISRVLGQFVVDPVYMQIPNGSSVRDVYFQRFKGVGIFYIDGLSPLIDNVVLEYGMDGAAGIVLQATQSAIVENVYTEGDMGTDISLTFKNSRACMSTRISSCWLNTTATKIIHAQSYRGLEIDNIVMQTPAASSLIDFTSASNFNDPIYVGYVSQVDQNANSFIGDVRGVGQTLIPIATDNTKIVVTKPFPDYGNGTDADLTNIANHTAEDPNGLLPRLFVKPRDAKANTAGGLTCVSSGTQNVFGSDSTGINLYSSDYGSCQLRITGVMDSSANVPTFSAFRITNATTSDTITTTVQNTGPDLGTYVLTINVNLAPGNNLIQLALTRAQGGSGTNTYTVSDYVIV